MELLHPASGLLPQLVRGVRAFGEAQALPEDHRGIFAVGSTPRDLGEAFPLRGAERRGRPKPADAPQACKPARLKALGQEVGQGRRGECPREVAVDALLEQAVHLPRVLGDLAGQRLDRVPRQAGRLGPKNNEDALLSVVS